MTGTTQPYNFKRIKIVWMMGLRFNRITLLAIQFFNFATFNINIKIGPCIHFYTLSRIKRMLFSPITDIFCVALQTISLTFSTWFKTMRAFVHVEHFNTFWDIIETDKILEMQ